MKLLIEIDAGIVSGVWCSEPENIEVVIRDLDLVTTGSETDPLLDDAEARAIRNDAFVVYND